MSNPASSSVPGWPDPDTIGDLQLIKQFGARIPNNPLIDVGNTFPNVTTGVTSRTTAIANRTAIQAALDSGGNVHVTNPGDVYIDCAVLIGSHTRLTLGQDTRLRLVNGTANPNNWGATTITSVGTAATVTVASPFPEAMIGKSMIMGVGGVSNQDGYNGLWQMQIVSANSATYQLVTSVGGVAATGNVTLFGPYMEYGYQDNVIRNKNFFSKKFRLSNPTVVGPISVGSVALRFDADSTGWQADQWILIKGDTTRALHGAHRIVEATSSQVTIEFFTTTIGFPGTSGTLFGALCDVDFIIEGGTVHGGGGNLDASWLSHGICLNKTAYAVVQNVKAMRVNKYAVTYCNSFAPTFRDIHLETVSDGLHSKGPNWSVVIDGIAGANNDDFIVHTANDPEQAYPFNVFPRNAGAVINAPQGTFTMGNTDQGTIASGGGELIGYTARNIRPKFKNARILLSGADAAKPFNGMSGVLIDGYIPNFDNEAYNGSYDIPSICISCEPSVNQTSRISDVTVRNWTIMGNAGKPFVNFYDQQVGGPYNAAQVVIDTLTFENVQTGRPIVRKAGKQWEFLDGRVWTAGDRWSVGKLSFLNCKWDIDTGTSGGVCSIVGLNQNNANGEYLGELLFDNCQLRQVAGDQVLRLLSLFGSSGSKLKKITVRNMRTSADVASTIEMIQLGNSGATVKPIVHLDSNHLGGTRFAVSSTGTPLTLIATNNVMPSAGYACFMWGYTALDMDIYWQNNILQGGVVAVDSGVTGYSVKSGDGTLALDLTKVSRASAGALARASVGAGTIVAGNLVVCDTSNAAGCWKQVSNTTLNY